LVQNLKKTIEKYINELKSTPMEQSSIENTVSRFENQINDLVGLTKQGLSKKVSFYSTYFYLLIDIIHLTFFFKIKVIKKYNSS
jgi:hypothetical protein